MNILVTGGAGFIGSNLVEELVKQGHRVMVWDNYSTGKEENCILTREDKPPWYYPYDISEQQKTGSEIDIIFHLAAQSRIQPSFSDPLDNHNSNITGTINILELAKEKNAKLIYAGSSSFYHDVHANPYAFAKWVGEQYCELYNKVYGVKTAIARFFNVYGPKQTCGGPYATVVGTFEKQYKEKTPLTITGSGENRRDFIHVDDIVSGLIAISEGEWENEIFNLGTGKDYSINELAAMFDAPIKYISRRPGEADITKADISKSKELLNWNPIIDLERYIDELKF